MSAQANYADRAAEIPTTISKFKTTQEFLTSPPHLAFTCPVCFMPCQNKTEFDSHIHHHLLFAEPLEHLQSTAKSPVLHACYKCGLAWMSAREYRSHWDEYHPFDLPQPHGSSTLKPKK
jgi:hypothetical protein